MSDPHSHDEPDGCLCDHPHADHEATPDHELPAALGGVQGDKKPRKTKHRPTKTPVGEGD